MEQLKKMKRLYPDLVPNVYLRLWRQDFPPEEFNHRKRMLKEAKRAWRKRLKAQGKLRNDGGYHENDDDSDEMDGKRPSPTIMSQEEQQ